MNQDTTPWIDMSLQDMIARLALKIGAENTDILLRAIDPRSASYGNLSHSTRLALPGISDSASRSRTGRLTKNREVIESLPALLDKVGCGRDVRLRMLRDVVSGGYRSTTKIVHRDAAGKVRSSSEIERSPSSADILKGVHLAEKLSGSIDNSRAKANAMGKGLEALIKRMLTSTQLDNKSAQMDNKENVQQDTGDGDRAGGGRDSGAPLTQSTPSSTAKNDKGPQMSSGEDKMSSGQLPIPNGQYPPF